MFIKYLARLWANLLPSLFVWEKLNETIGIGKNFRLSFVSKCCMTISESPSRTAWLTPISKANSKDLAAAAASTSAVDRSWWICWDIEAMMSLLEDIDCSVCGIIGDAKAFKASIWTTSLILQIEQ